MGALSLDGVRKSYGSVAALRSLSLEVANGELFVLVGPSGCGKTTALRVVAGLEAADAGRIQIGGREVTGAPPAARDVAMVFQSYALFPHMTVYDNLAFGLAARRRATSEIRSRVAEAAAALGLDGLLDRFPRQLSGGERQRVALGRAMVRRPSLFLMDEPLSNLDAPLRAQTRGEIVRLQRSLGIATVYVTHDQTEALGMGDRVGVLRDGALEQIGTPDEVYRSPASLFVARFLGNPPINAIDVRREGDALVWAGGRLPAPPVAPWDAVLGVRPEHVHIVGSRWAAGAHPGPSFRARLELLERAGDQTLVTLDASGARLMARVEPAFRAAAGDEIEAWFDPDHLLLFDRSTGAAVL